jgi:YVTN family beta-propeller protein
MVSDLGKIYVANADSNSISVINIFNDTKEPQDIAVGKDPRYMLSVGGFKGGPKIYVSNLGNDTVSVINTSNDTKEPHDIAVGNGPSYMVLGRVARVYDAFLVANEDLIISP